MTSSRPKLVFFFDEAHLLFDESSKVVLEKVEQVVRLVRSKGVGVFFVSQSPLDIRDAILGQLGNRVQHALRAFTPKDQKAVKAAAQTFRSDGSVNVEQAISELAVGEALVSMLDEKGSPLPVETRKIAPPRSRLGTISADERQQIVRNSQLFGRYEHAVDRESAYEILKSRSQGQEAPATKKSGEPGAKTSKRQNPLEAMLSSTARSVGTQLGRQLVAESWIPCSVATPASDDPAVMLKRFGAEASRDQFVILVRLDDRVGISEQRIDGGREQR